MGEVRDEMDQKLIDCIEKYGWFALSVASRADGSEDGPVFTYSIGFETSLGIPNIITFGLKTNVMHHMIGQVYDALKQGKQMADETIWREPLENYECITRAVHPTQVIPDHFGYGLWYHNKYLGRTAPYQAFQLFWPGVVHKLLPWEEGCDDTVIDAQPRLDLPRKDLH